MEKMFFCGIWPGASCNGSGSHHIAGPDAQSGYGFCLELVMNVISLQCCV